MGRWIKRLLVLLVIGGTGRAAYRVLRSRSDGPTTPSPEWPPFEPSPPAEFETAAEGATSESPEWLAPVDGECPPGYPIKANDNSHIYHVPGGRFYDRPIAERCYATEEAAQRDGYRRAKS